MERYALTSVIFILGCAIALTAYSLGTYRKPVPLPRIGILLVLILLITVQANILYQRGVIDARVEDVKALNEAHGCGDEAPKEVPYTPGMTLCPGQSTTITVPLQPPGHDL